MEWENYVSDSGNQDKDGSTNQTNGIDVRPNIEKTSNPENGQNQTPKE